MAKNIYEMVTAKVIESLENGVLPWQKPWVSIMNGSACAINYRTRKPYSLINQLFLKEGEYVSMTDIKNMQKKNNSVKIKKGAKAYWVYGWFKSYKNLADNTYEEHPTITEDNEDNYRVIWNFKGWKVFHIEDCENIPSRLKEMPTQSFFEHEDIANAEDAITLYVEREKKVGFAFHNVTESNQAFYAPLEDKVVVPSKKQFKNIVEYYSTAFHELTHSTGAEKRLNRKGVANFDHFGSHQYSEEELVAELGSAMILGILGIDNSQTFNNSVAYLQSWLKSFQNDSKMIVLASRQAEKAVEFILKGKK